MAVKRGLDAQPRVLDNWIVAGRRSMARDVLEVLAAGLRRSDRDDALRDVAEYALGVLDAVAFEPESYAP